MTYFYKAIRVVGKKPKRKDFYNFRSIMKKQQNLLRGRSFMKIIYSKKMRHFIIYRQAGSKLGVAKSKTIRIIISPP